MPHELNAPMPGSVAANLPGLEAVVKELEEVKKAIEVRRPIYCPRSLKRSTVINVPGA